MPNSKSAFNLPVFVLVCVSITCLLGIGMYRLEIDADIVGSLPVDDPILSDAQRIIASHPMQDQFVIDIGQRSDNPEAIIRAADFVVAELIVSGLFRQVGMAHIFDLGPELIRYAAQNLPVLFNENDLRNEIAPLMEPSRIHRRLNKNFTLLTNLAGIGQTRLLTYDPLGIRNVALAKMSALAMSPNARVVNGHLLSDDNRHVLLTARPDGSGTDTAFSRQALEVLQDISVSLDEKFAANDNKFSLTPVGAFRAALDNENMAKRDIQRVILFATIGIALLLLLAFPRPYIGLLSLFPAIVGAIAAIFIYSLLHRTISLLTLGFGGAIISITVDHGIAYLLFLDRPHGSSGREAAREIWAIGLLAALTSIGAFLTLSFSGFAILAQIGQFAAVGIACSFLFIHLVFPRIFATMPPMQRKKQPLLAPLVAKLTQPERAYTAFTALAFALIMLIFARPEFNTDFRAMNTVSRETRDAEKLVTEVWGDVGSKILLMSETDSLETMRIKSDHLAAIVENGIAAGTLASGFVPAMLFPGQTRGAENFSAWQAFWTDDRINTLRDALVEASQTWGFTADAFEPFFNAIGQKAYQPIDIPKKFYPLLGILRQKENNNNHWLQHITLSPGPAYRDIEFYKTISDSQTALVFDPRLFATTLGQHLTDTFTWMVLVIGISVTILLFVFFFDWQLTLAALLPVAFAFTSTLGTLKLLGRPLDIPGLMLSIVIFGMGIDYALYFVRSYQRYRELSHPSVRLVHMAIFLAAASTLIGFGSLNFADHRLLNSAGLTCSLGIGYSLIGAIAILPPVLKWLFRPVETTDGNARQGKQERHIIKRILIRYRHMEPIARFTAHLQARRDPMFREPFPLSHSPQTVLDVGTGYGLSAAWLIELFPDVRFYGIALSPEYARVSGLVVGGRGRVSYSAAIDIPALPDTEPPLQLATMIDTLDQLSDAETALTLEKIQSMLCFGGHLLTRVTLSTKVSVIERVRQKLTRWKKYHRTEDQLRGLITQAGLEPVDVRPCGDGEAGHWMIARKGECKDDV